MRKAQKNPKTISIDDVLADIRRKCMDCCANQIKVVKECKSLECALHPYRSVDEISKLNIKR